LNPRRIITIAGASLVAALCAAAAAFATNSSTVYPAGDSVSASSVPITITGAATENCTLNGGAFTIPAANHNSSGPVTMGYSTRPTYTSCSGSWSKLTIATSGSWTLAAQYGQVAATLTIPAGGLTLSNIGECPSGSNASTVAFTGIWNNGFTTPKSVSSTMTYAGPVTITACGAKLPLTFEWALQTLTDTTHPSSLPLLGP
jgi:hypothetical protein